MKGTRLRKILVVIIITVSLFASADCKKQVRCGCGNDVLLTLTNASANIYPLSSSSIYFNLVGDPYSTYFFCNPSEMYPKLTDAKYGDVLLVSGHVYWDCQYVYQSSNSSYQSIYKQYQVQVTDVTLNLYGKK